MLAAATAPSPRHQIWTDQRPEDSPCGSPADPAHASAFEGFSYVAPSFVTSSMMALALGTKGSNGCAGAGASGAAAIGAGAEAAVAASTAAKKA